MYHLGKWIPDYKYQLLDWFAKNRPAWKWSKLAKMSYKKLMAIYMKERWDDE